MYVMSPTQTWLIGAGALILKDTAEDQVYRGTASKRARVPSHRLPKL